MEFRLILCIALFSTVLIMSAVSQQTDESIDDLFEEPAEDIIVENTETDHITQFEQEDKISFSGSFSATGGGAVGWKETPDFSDPLEGLDAEIGAKSLARVKFNAKPDPDFAVTGNFYTEIDPGSGNTDWSEAKIDELFCDYTWLDTAFLRIGKHKITWGQGRLFTPGNLMENSEDGVAFRVSFPSVFSGLSFVTLLDENLNTSGESLSSKDVAAGALLDTLFGSYYYSAGTRYQRNEGLRVLNSLKKVVLKTDIFTDLVFTYDDIRDDYFFQTVAGFFREWDDFKLYGEYSFDGKTSGGEDHSVGIALGYNNLFSSPVDLGLEWKHGFMDNSGKFLPGISWSPWKFVKSSIAVPVNYGTTGSRYYNEDDEDLSGRRVAFVMTLELSASF